MPDLLLGPIQRYADETCATIWVETDGACEVAVLDGSARTFRVHDHHYALVEVTGLAPGAIHPYEVALDGRRVWPPDGYELPQPVVRTRSGRDTRIAFGSCRGAAPLEPPWTLDKGEDARGLGPDALVAYAHRMIEADHVTWPDLLLFLGDQVYADEASPRTRELIRARRDVSMPPGEEIADFEEYTHLYREAWSQPLVRWLLSTVPVAMIFDDHDIIDDWNISQRWLDDIRATDWWAPRIIGGLTAYWIYQHLGNLSPASLAEDDLYRRARTSDDAGEMIDAFARTADADPTTARWSFDRCLGDTHLLVVDSRAARVLDEGSRDMLDQEEWRWLEERVRAPSRHVLIGSSLPILMPRSLHDVERWNQQVAAGAWGRRAARVAERMRREFDLEHWPAFPRGFDRMMRLVTDLARREGPPGEGERQRAGGRGSPDSITLLSGDVHHAYVSRLALDEGAAPVHQVVASPMRQTVTPALLRVYEAGVGAVGRRLGRTMASLAGLTAPPVAWDQITEPLFANHLATIDLSGGTVSLRIERAHQTRPSGPAELRPAIELRLA